MLTPTVSMLYSGAHMSGSGLEEVLQKYPEWINVGVVKEKKEMFYGLIGVFILITLLSHVCLLSPYAGLSFTMNFKSVFWILSLCIHWFWLAYFYLLIGVFVVSCRIDVARWWAVPEILAKSNGNELLLLRRLSCRRKVFCKCCE